MVESRFFFKTRIFFSSREFFSRVENLFFESRIFFFRVENFFMESRIFSWSRESCHRDDNFISCRDYFCRVENYFFESNSDNQSRFFPSSRDLFVESKIFSLSREYPTCHAVSCRQNDQTIWRSADL